jgi:hypothetical protein
MGLVYSETCDYSLSESLLNPNLGSVTGAAIEGGGWRAVREYGRDLTTGTVKQAI